MLKYIISKVCICISKLIIILFAESIWMSFIGFIRVSCLKDRILMLSRKDKNDKRREDRKSEGKMITG